MKTNKEYLDRNIGNILTGYIKSRALYFDGVTGLKNFNKLNKDLMQGDQESLTFMEIHLNSIEYVNNKFDYQTGDSYYRAIVNAIANKILGGEVYRLSGVRFGILLSIYDDYNEILNMLDKLKIEIRGETIDPDMSVGIGIANGSRVLRKSSIALNEAMQVGEKMIIKT